MTDAATLERRLAEGDDVTVVDVRGRDEYTGAPGHIPKSLNIPLPELPARLPDGEGRGVAARRGLYPGGSAARRDDGMEPAWLRRSSS